MTILPDLCYLLDLPADVSVLPLENHELVVTGTYPQGKACIFFS